jgi:hypothetical protein
MRPRMIGSISLTIATGAAVLATATAPAAAAPPATQRHCVVALAATAAGGTTVCYTTFEAAVSRATGARVSGMTRAGTALDAAINGANLSATTKSTGGGGAATKQLAASYPIVIAIEYTDDDYEGNTIVYTTPYGCDSDWTDADWYVNEFPSGWNDEIESFQAFAGCRPLYHMHSYLRGPMLSFTTSYGDLLWMNDEASSVEWS